MIHVMRHAESRLNAGLPDERNCDLSDQGKEQAAKETGHYDLVLTSPLFRAKQTLDHSQIQYKHRLEAPCCRESRNPIFQCDYLEKEVMFQETSEQLFQRTEELVSLLRHLQKVFPRILVITHGLFLRQLLNQPHAIYQNCQRIPVYLVEE